MEASERSEGEPRVGAVSTEELFARYAEGIFNFCRRVTGDEAAAEDLTQEVFVRALQYGGSFEGRSSPSTWLYRIASNLCRDHFRRTRRYQPVGAGVLVRLVGARRGEAERKVEEIEMRSRIRWAIEQLTDNQREALILSRYHGRTYAEIGAITGQSEGAVKAAMFRAMNRLRSLLAESGDEG